MAKNFPYFKFTATEWMTGNIVYESFAVQGLFINICALYWQRDGQLTIDDINKRYRNPVELSELTDRFISVTDGFISVKFLDEQLVAANHISTQNSINGKKGGRPKRPITVVNKPTANPSLSDPKAKKSKEEEEKEQEKEKEQEQDVAENSSNLSATPETPVKASNRFIPPTVEEVKTYFTIKGYTAESAMRAFEYYDISGWVDSKGSKIRNWKQKMLSVWFKPEHKVQERKMVY